MEKLTTYQKWMEVWRLIKEASISFCCIAVGILAIRGIVVEKSAQNTLDEAHRTLLEINQMVKDVRKNTADQEAFATHQLPKMYSDFETTIGKTNDLIDSLKTTSDGINSSRAELTISANAAVNSLNDSVKKAQPVLDSLNDSVKSTKKLTDNLTVATKSLNDTIVSVNAIVSEKATKDLPANANRLVSNAADATGIVKDGLNSYFHPALWQKVSDGVRTSASVVSAGATVAGVGVLKFIKKVF